jgi:ELWxxDGT repeat protein
MKRIKLKLLPLALLLALFATTSLHAQIKREINNVLELEGPTTNTEFAGKITEFNGKLFFTADDGVHGFEPWYFDTTTGEGKILKDMDEGPGSSGLQEFIVSNDKLYFEALGSQWVSDGTEAGTIKSTEKLSIYSYLDKDYFIAIDENSISALWVADETTGDTTYLTNLVYASDFTPFNGEIFFSGYTTNNIPSLYKTNGTSAGTLKINNSEELVSFAPLNGQLIFSTSSRFWRNDGTQSGNTLIEIMSSNSKFVEYNAQLYFVSSYGGHGSEVWKTNGTTQGTTIVKNLAAGSSSGVFSQLVKLRDEIYFLGQEENAPVRIWKTDGTQMLPVTEENKPGFYSQHRFLHSNGDKLYFYAFDSDHGEELWQSDGTAAGTSLALDVNKNLLEMPLDAIAFNDELYFPYDKDEKGRELYAFNPATKTLRLVKDIIPNGGSSPTQFFVLNNLLYFVTNENGLTFLYMTNGTSEGTIKLDEVAGPIAVLNNKILFVKRAADGGYEVFSTDGMQPGSTLLKDINPSVAESGFAGGAIISTGDKAFFHGIDGSTVALWTTDGTEGGTFPLIEGSFVSLKSLNGKLYFTNEGWNKILYESDGSTQGTRIIKDFTNDPDGTFIYSINLHYNNKILFTAYGNSAGLELWVSDGTSVGTHILKEFNPTGGSNPAFLQYAYDQVIFGAENNDGARLFLTDGTDAGTSQIEDFVPKYYFDLSQDSNQLFDKLYFLSSVDGIGRLLELDRDKNVEIIGNFKTSLLQKTFEINNKIYFFADTQLKEYSLSVNTPVTLQNTGTFRYDGNVHAATATTNPANLNVTVTYNSESTLPLNAGTYEVKATVEDVFYQGEAIGTIVIEKATQIVDIVEISNKEINAAPFTTNATSTSGLPVAISVVSGPATVNGNTVTLTGQSGTVVLKATQQGNENYLSAEATESFEVAKKAQTIEFKSIANKITGAAPFTVEATSTSGLPVVITVVSGPATVNGKTVTLTSGTGTVKLEASQEGNENYLAAEAEQSFEVVQKQTQTITFTPVSDKVTTDVPFTVAATSTSGLPVMISVVSGPAAINGNIVTLKGEAGTVTLKATQAGNENYLAAEVLESFDVSEDLVMGLEESRHSTVSAYPVPSKDNLSIESKHLNISSITVLNPLGNVVDQHVLANPLRSHTLSVKQYPVGILIVQIIMENKVKIIKKIEVIR